MFDAANNGDGSIIMDYYSAVVQPRPAPRRASSDADVETHAIRMLSPLSGMDESREIFFRRVECYNMIATVRMAILREHKQELERRGTRSPPLPR